MRRRHVAAIDQGTTSSRCLIVDDAGALVASAQAEHRQITPRPGWVEHDPLEIWAAVERTAAEALANAGLAPADLAAVGITNQRETTLVWDADTGEPLANAIVWQDTRTDALCRDLGGEAGADRFRAQTGLPLATYFSGPKLRWLLDSVPGARARAARGALKFGTVDSWLIWNLTGAHATDPTNASRTLLMNLATLDWDDELLAAIDIPRAMLPAIVPSVGVIGEARGVLAGAPVAAVLGDQQAALFGQACFAPGEGKCTFGTGAFLLVNTGARPIASKSGLLTTIAAKIGDGPATYALEGSVAVAGSLVQWLRDRLGVIASAAEIEGLAASVPDSGGCVFVPAFSGLFAPWWRDDARGVICGLTGYVGKAHLARAALDAVAWQTGDVVDAMIADMGGAGLAELKVDGGMTVNGLLMQTLADVLGRTVRRPAHTESTALGAAAAAGLAVGLWDKPTLAARWREDAAWRPTRGAGWREQGARQWRKAVERSMGWAG